MDLEDVPSSEQITKELLQIVHELDHFPRLRFPGLELLPSVRRFQAPSGRSISEPERRRLGIYRAINEGIGCFHDGKEQTALEQLFAFEALDRPVGERLDLAAKALTRSSGDALRRGREETLLRTLASEICRRELWLSLQRVEGLLDPVRMGVTPCRIVERDLSVVITNERPEEQLWETRIVWKFLESTAQPVVLVEMPWTGTGSHDAATIKVLSGPQPGEAEYDLKQHRLLGIVPEADPARSRYFWHLGAFANRGVEVELRFTQKLVDLGKTFSPVISLWTRHDSIVRYLRLRAQVAPSLVENPRAFEQQRGTVELEDGRLVPHFMEPEELQHIVPDGDGWYVYEPPVVRPGVSYSLWWGPEARG